MLTLCYAMRCISTNECEGEPLRCPTVPTTPSRPCEVVPTSRTPRHNKHIISKIGPSKMLTLHHVIRRISTNECAREPQRCPRNPMTPHSPYEVVPTSRTPRHKKHIISKIRPVKNVNLVLCYAVHLHKWMRTWTPTVSHDSNDTMLIMWGCAHFENTSSQETHNF